MADTPGLEPGAARHGGSSPSLGTTLFKIRNSNFLPLPIFKSSFFNEDDVAIFLKFIFELNKPQSKKISSLILKSIKINRDLPPGKLDLDQI
jgi:hypothetical protein